MNNDNNKSNISGRGILWTIGIVILIFYGGSIRVIHALIASLRHLQPKTSLHLIVNGIT